MSARAAQRVSGCFLIATNSIIETNCIKRAMFTKMQKAMLQQQSKSEKNTHKKRHRRQVRLTVPLWMYGKPKSFKYSCRAKDANAWHHSNSRFSLPYAVHCTAR